MTTASVPFLDLSRAFKPLRNEVDEAIALVLDSMGFILGAQGRALEEDCARRVGAAGAAGVASGTDALILSYRALDLVAGDEVITSPFSFFASAGAIIQAGGRPRFADIDPVTFNLDPQAARAAIGPATRALCPVHLYGQTADMQPLMAAAAERGLSVVEDAAQAIGAGQDGRQAGALGDAAAFSFYPTKNLGGIGDGGLVTSTSNDFVEKVRLLRHHGQSDAYRHTLVGTNSRLDEIQAAVLRVKLDHLDDWTEARRRAAATLSRLLLASGVAVSSEGTLGGADLALPVEKGGNHHVYNLFTVRARRRDDLKAYLGESGIGCGVYYPLPLHLQPCFSFLGYQEGAFPQAEAASREVLSLPLFPGISHEELERVAATVAGFYGVK